MICLFLSCSNMIIYSHPFICPLYLPILKTKPNRNGKVNVLNSISGVGFGRGDKKEVKWECVKGCGACCKLDKGPKYPSPQDIFHDPSDVQLVTSLTGPDGWCIHYDKSLRACSIYSDRPYFCRVEPEIFDKLYGVDKKRFDKEACSFCRDAIKTVYGPKSKELANFNTAIRKGSQN